MLPGRVRSGGGKLGGLARGVKANSATARRDARAVARRSGAEFDNPGGWALTMRFYSMMYGAPSIMVNRVRAERELTFWGGSRIVDPFGREVAVAGRDEDLITATLDYEQFRLARRLLPTVRDSNISLVHRETPRLIEKPGMPDFIRPES